MLRKFYKFLSKDWNFLVIIFKFKWVTCFLIFFRLLIWRLHLKAKCAIGWPLATKFTRLATAVKRKNWSTLFSANGNQLPIIGSTITFYCLLDISSPSSNGMPFSTQSFSKDLGKWKVTWSTPFRISSKTPSSLSDKTIKMLILHRKTVDSNIFITESSILAILIFCTLC